jgi:hypothetical protein
MRTLRVILYQAPLLLSALLLDACGYIGFEGAGDAQPSARVDAGMDAESEPPVEDAEIEVDADEMDAEPSDAEPTDAGPNEAAQADAAAPDAGSDAGLDGSDMDAATSDADLSDASLMDAALMDSSSTDAALDADLLDGESEAEAGDTGPDARPATQVTDYCSQVPALPEAPLIDGVIDGALHLVTLTPVGWTNTNVPLPSHTHAEFALAFRPDGLYAYVRVYDPNRLPALLADAIWRGDGVELYVDDNGMYTAPPAYDNPGTIQIIVAAPEDGTTPSTRSTRFVNAVDRGAWVSARFSAFPTSDGYVLEGFVEASALGLGSWTLASGGKVGVDLSINVSALDSEFDAGIQIDGRRMGQYFLNVGPADGCAGRPFCTSAGFCNPTLVD